MNGRPEVLRPSLGSTAYDRLYDLLCQLAIIHQGITADSRLRKLRRLIRSLFSSIGRSARRGASRRREAPLRGNSEAIGLLVGCLLRCASQHPVTIAYSFLICRCLMVLEKEQVQGQGQGQEREQGERVFQQDRTFDVPG